MSSFDDAEQGAGAPGGGGSSSAISGAVDKVRRTLGGSTVPPAPPPPPGEEDDDDEGMARMSFMEHLEELRTRLLRMVFGVILCAVACMSFSKQLWDFVRQPARQALLSLGYGEDLVQITPMEAFNVIWFKMPLMCAVFVASPWILYQVWGFISPGLYRRERRWAAPFILVSAGLFILGGCFAYFVVFRYGLTFLLSIGSTNYVTPMVTISEYFDLFVNVMLGVALVFELPVLIFFLTLLRILNPLFLLRHSRYAILAIFILAAIVTPTPDVFNLMLFAAPMCLLFYVGIFASYLLVLHREQRGFPWGTFVLIVTAVLLVLAGMVYLAITKFGYHLVPKWPFLMH
jgi:sec-independent protein translocase protein TatC